MQGQPSLILSGVTASKRFLLPPRASTSTSRKAGSTQATTAGTAPTVPAPRGISELVSRLDAFFAEHGKFKQPPSHEQQQDSKLLIDLLRGVPTKGNDFDVYNAFHDKTVSYTRHLIECGDCYQLLLCCWNAGQGGDIHNHASGSTSYMKVIEGEMQENIYKYQHQHQSDEFDEEKKDDFQAVATNLSNIGASVTLNSNIYMLDRYQFVQSAAGKLTVQQNAGSVTPPVGFSNYMGITSTSAYSVGSTEYFYFQQPIEGYNVADLNWGTANAKTVTLSFQVYSSLTGTFGGALQNSAQNRSYPFSYSIPTANTWTSISITIAGDTTGTWLTTNGAGIQVIFGLGVGLTSINGTAGAWVASDKRSVTGATSIVGTSGATFYITGVQLEVGSTATSFDYRPYGTELALCQRYYEFNGQSYNCIWNGNTTSGSTYYKGVTFIVTKRTTPTIATITNLSQVGFPATASTATDLSIGGFQLSRTSNSTVNSGYFIDTWVASAEL